MSNSQAQKQISKSQQIYNMQNNLKNYNNIPQQIEQWIAVYIDNQYYLTSTSAYQKLQNLQNQIQQEKKRANGTHSKQSEQVQRYKLAQNKEKKQVPVKKDRKDSLQSAFSRQCRTEINQIKILKAKFEAEKQLAFEEMKYQNKTLQVRKRRQLKQTSFIIKQHNNIRHQQRQYRRQQSIQQKQVSVKKSRKSSIKNFMIAPHQLSGKKSLQKSREKSRVSQIKQKQLYYDEQQQGDVNNFKQFKRNYQTIQPRKTHHNNHKQQRSQYSQIQNSNTVKRSQVQNNMVNQKHHYINNNGSKSKQKSFVINRRPPTSNSNSKSYRNSSLSKNLRKDNQIDDVESQQTYSKDQIQKLSTKLRQMQQKLMKVEKRQKQLELIEKERQKQRQLRKELQDLQTKAQKNNKNGNKISHIGQMPNTNNNNQNNVIVNSIKFKNQQQKSNIKLNKEEDKKQVTHLHQNITIKPDQQLSQQIIQLQQNSQFMQSSIEESTPIKSIKKLRNLKLANSIIQYNYNEQLVRSKKQYEESHQKQLMSSQIQQLKRVIRQLQIDKIKQEALMRDLNEKQRKITQKDNIQFQNQQTKRINIDNFVQQYKGGRQKKEKHFRYQIKNNKNKKDKFSISLGQIQQNLKTIKANKNKQQFFSIKEIPETEATPFSTIPLRNNLDKYEPSSMQFISESSDKPLIKKQARRFLKVQSKITQQLNLSKQLKKAQQKQESPSRVKSISSNNECFVLNSQQIKSRLSGRSSNQYSMYSNRKKSNPESRDQYKNIVYQNELEDEKQFVRNREQTQKPINERQKSTKSREQSMRKSGLIMKQIINKDKLKTLEMKKQKINKNDIKNTQKQLKINSNTSQYTNKVQQIQQPPSQGQKSQKQRIHDEEIAKKLAKPIINIPQIQIPLGFALPILPSPPTIQSTQGQILSQVKKVCDLLQIKIQSKQHPQFKKYRNCVMVRMQGDSRVIVWHYSGKFYIGGWNDQSVGDDRKDGFGIQIIPQKHCYKGNFYEGKRHGQGTIVTMNGNIYKGEWIKGQKNGKGIGFDNTTKAIYMGEWRQGKRHGQGILKLSQKQYYQGQFDKNIKQGFGRQLFGNGDCYEGEYKDGSFDGEGKYFWANGSVYCGNFVQGFREGYGIWKSDIDTGDLYEGQYKKDKKSGKGKYTWFKGCSFEGQFINDLKHGKGRVQYPDGREIRGIWEFGRLKEVQKSNKNSLVQFNDQFVQISPRIQPNIAKMQQVN